MSNDLKTVLDQVDAGLTDSLDRLFALLRIPSVSTDPAHDAACRRCADWLRETASALGFRVEVLETPGKPVVVAHTPPELAEAEGPRALFYGHYDVQPPDPLDLWHAPPFEPSLQDGPRGQRIVARGASDDKGQLMTFLEACRAWLFAKGRLPLPVTLLLEGEEEIGSVHLPPFLQTHQDLLQADVALVCDTGMWAPGQPAITATLRGILATEITLRCANRDLHSGIYGSAARNPIHVLVGLLAQLRDEKGRIQIPGFYDSVGEIPPILKREWERLNFNGKAFLERIGLSEPAGECDYGVLEQVWARPTCEVNGICGGFTGQGSKTVIPAEAFAKLSFRLVGQQQPAEIERAFEAFVRSRMPSDCQVRFTSVAGAGPCAVDLDGPYLTAAQAALTDEFGVRPVLVGSGGSIPVVQAFKERLGLDSLLVGFALDDDQVHSPNEKYDLNCYHKGTRAWVRILAALAEQRRTSRRPITEPVSAEQNKRNVP